MPSLPVSPAEISTLVANGGRSTSPVDEDALTATAALCARATTLFAGSVVQLSGDGTLSLAVVVARQFLRRYAQPLPWILSGVTVPYPPDLYREDIDLNRLFWFSPNRAEEMRYTIDTLLGSGVFPAVFVELRNFFAFTPGTIARFMHRARHNGTALFFILPRYVASPSPAIAYHFEVARGSSIQRDIVVHRSRKPIRNGVCHVIPPVFLL